MKPNPICITKQKLLFENERDIEKKGIDEIPYTNLCCVFFLCFILLSLSLPLFFVLSVFAVCIFALSFCICLLFFLFRLFSFFFSSCLPLFIERLRRSCSLIFLTTDQIVEQFSSVFFLHNS